jgi:hypothetical protein
MIDSTCWPRSAGGEPAGNESVPDLHALDVARVRHDIEERTIQWQRALELRKFGGARLLEQLCLLARHDVSSDGDIRWYV